MIDSQTLASLKKWFDGYTATFDSADADHQKNINIKVEHSHRVCDAIRQIGQSVGLSKGELNLAEAAALFHDVGRFEQFKRYNTFSDHHSVNHAELGVNVLRENRVLEVVDSTAKEILLHAVSNHNRLAIPKDESETHRFFSQLLRDADKLDIWRVVCEHYTSENGTGNGVNLGLPDTPGISPAVYHDLMHRRLVAMSHLCNVNDFKLLQMGWVYDVHFPKTLELVQERGYLEMLRDALPRCAEVADVYTRVVSFIQEKKKIVNARAGENTSSKT